MKAVARTLVAGAAVIAVALVCVGCGAAGNNAGVGQVTGAPVPTPTAVASAAVVAKPTASTAPTASPAPSAAPAASGASSLAQGQYVACDAADTAKSCLAPGTYQLTGDPGVWPVTVTLDLPAGWFEVQNGDLGLAGSGWDAVLVQGGADTQYSGTGWGVMFTTVGDVYRDPCDASKGRIPAAQVDTPQKLAAAIAAWPKFTVTAPHPITVDGHAGVELALARTTGTGCAGAPDTGPGVTWLSASNAAVDGYPFVSGPKYRTIVRIVDTGHGLLVIRAADFLDPSPYELQLGVAPSATRHTADMPKLQAILDSIRLTAKPR